MPLVVLQCRVLSASGTDVGVMRYVTPVHRVEKLSESCSYSTPSMLVDRVSVGQKDGLPSPLRAACHSAEVSDLRLSTAVNYTAASCWREFAASVCPTDAPCYNSKLHSVDMPAAGWKSRPVDPGRLKIRPFFSLCQASRAFETIRRCAPP